jgi:hypothetical protein
VFAESSICLDAKETKNQGSESSAVNCNLLRQFASLGSNPKRKELASLKQLFFLRIFQLIDTRFQIISSVRLAGSGLRPFEIGSVYCAFTPLHFVKAFPRKLVGCIGYCLF